MERRSLAVVLGLLLLVTQVPLAQGYPQINYPAPKIEPIVIIGNADFASSGAVVSGNGTESDPYIIEGWAINASSFHGIYVTNTDAYLVIRNCTVYGTGDKYGIYLKNSSNAKVENCELLTLVQGIRAEGVESCVLEGNLVQNSTIGIFIEASDKVVVANNTLEDNRYGIFVLSSSDTSVLGNDCSGSLAFGVSLQGAHGNQVIQNNFSGSGYAGISISMGSYDNVITENDCSHGGGNGIECYDSFNNSISWNDCRYSAAIGLLVVNSSNNSLVGNNCSYSGSYGMRFQSSSNNTLIANDASHMSQGTGALFHVSSDGNVLANCTFSFNSHGLEVDMCKGISLSSCRIHNNTAHGLWNSASDPVYVVYAPWCWWGSPGGPSGVGPGSGDKVSKNVIYYPWVGDRARLTVTLNASATAVNLTGTNVPATVSIDCTISPYIATTPINIKVTSPGGQVTTIPVNAEAPKFSFNVTLDRGGDWTVLAEVPGSDFLEPVVSSTLRISVTEPSGGAAGGGELVYAGIAVAFAAAGALYAMIRKAKRKEQVP